VLHETQGSTRTSPVPRLAPLLAEPTATILPSGWTSTSLALSNPPKKSFALMWAFADCAQAKDIQVTAGDYYTCAWVKNVLAELAVAVVAPALEVIVVELGAGLVADRADLLRAVGHTGRRVAAQVDGGQRVAHAARHITARRGVAQAKLAVGVVAPALDLLVAEQCAAMRRTGSDARGGVGQQRGWIGAQVDGQQVVPHLIGGPAARQRVAQAELAGSVVAPALDLAVVEQRTRMERARGDPARRAAGAEVDGEQCAA